jgi:hypothetical protein
MIFRPVLLLSALSFSSLFAQQQAPAPPPQTPRQALIEMITGGQQGALKHLTIEMQKSLEADGKQSAQDLAMFDQIKSASSDFKVFETGEVLLAADGPKNNEKFEVHVDSDDLSGDTDNLDISFHQFKDGIEQPVRYATLLSRFTVGLKRQDNIWRLNEISVNIKVPVGDPKLLEKVGEGSPGLMLGGMTGFGVSASSKAQKTRDWPPKEAIMMVAFAESTYASRHPEIGFTCSLADLGENDGFDLDPNIFSGEPYRGYKFALSGCQGKPSGSFHLIAEPVSPAAGAKAYCTDATHNVRSSDDGRGATCLISGKSPRMDREENSVVFERVTPDTKKSQEK